MFVLKLSSIGNLKHHEQHVWLRKCKILSIGAPVLAPGVALRRSERSRSWWVRVGLAPAISLAVASCRNNWEEVMEGVKRSRREESKWGWVIRVVQHSALSGVCVCVCCDTSLQLTQRSVACTDDKLELRKRAHPYAVRSSLSAAILYLRFKWRSMICGLTLWNYITHKSCDSRFS